MKMLIFLSLNELLVGSAKTLSVKYQRQPERDGEKFPGEENQ
jgi:hypothetical protein